jgi:TRAP-type C4-dicarboxylate transport system substrate-binding protein
MVRTTLSLMCCIALVAGVPAQAVTTLSMTTEYPATSMPGEGVATFAALVAEKTRGAVIVQPGFDASAGFKSADMVDAVEHRKVDAADAFAGALANRYPVFGVSSLPFLADSLDKARALDRAARPAYQHLLAAHGQKLLYTTPWPASGIWSKRPIRSVDDLKTLSVRTYDATSQAVMTNVGARAANLSFADAIPRLAAGDVNAVLSSGDGGAGRKLWQYLPSFAEVNYAMPVSVATMNLAVYEALDAASRRAIDQAAALTEIAQWKLIEGRLEANYRTMGSNGVAIDRTVAPAVMEALRRASSSQLADWERANCPDAMPILARYRGVEEPVPPCPH